MNQMESLELYNKITEVKNSLNGLNSRMEISEKWNSEHKNRSKEIIQYKQDRENRLKNNEQSIRDLEDSNKI